MCQHCKQCGLECSFFLPIKETRFKRKTLEREAVEKDKSSGSADPSELERGSISQSDKQSKLDVNVFATGQVATVLSRSPAEGDAVRL